MRNLIGLLAALARRCATPCKSPTLGHRQGRVVLVMGCFSRLFLGLGWLVRTPTIAVVISAPSLSQTSEDEEHTRGCTRPPL